MDMDRYANTDKDLTVRMLIGAVGIFFLLAGLWGFVDPSFFGLFNLTTAHNWVHIVTGSLYAIIAFAPVDLNVVAWVARIGGIVYVLLGVVGFFAPNMLAPLLHFGANENVFHVIMGSTLTVLGFLLPVHDADRTGRASTTATHGRH